MDGEQSEMGAENEGSVDSRQSTIVYARSPYQSRAVGGDPSERRDVTALSRVVYMRNVAAPPPEAASEQTSEQSLAVLSVISSPPSF